MGRINQRELEEKTKKHLKELIDLMIQRNKKYSTTNYAAKEATSNFWRNAELNRILRIEELLDQPYGISIEYVVQKVDRLINGILVARKEFDSRTILNVKSAWYPFITTTASTKKTISDSIDDAIVYLIITKRILEEMGL